jgi:hypothetical protein
VRQKQCTRFVPRSQSVLVTGHEKRPPLEAALSQE